MSEAEPENSRVQLHLNWTDAIPPGAWSIYQRAMEALRDAKIDFLLGGGFALAVFVGRWRDTKDIDLYVRPQDRERAIEAIRQAGFEDYYSRLPYDRKWIYRSFCQDCIVDLIWAMANQRAQVDEQWFQRKSVIQVRGQTLGLLPIEEFMWCKFYILQRDHCDWIDLLNLLYASGPQMNWPYLLERLGPDRPLLEGLLKVFGWLCPGRARELPGLLWDAVGMEPPAGGGEDIVKPRVQWLDSRAWFAALQPEDGKLEV